MTTSVTVPEIRARKCRRGDEPIVMITAYDAPFARVVDAAGVDIILVGDTLAEVVSDRRHLARGDRRHGPPCRGGGPRSSEGPCAGRHAVAQLPPRSC